MKWTTLDFIKTHSRIDDDCDDTLLEVYACAAEEAIENLTGRTNSEFRMIYGDVPDGVKVATAMLTEHFYTNRSPISPMAVSSVPYTIDFILKPYFKLSHEQG